MWAICNGIYSIEITFGHMLLDKVFRCKFSGKRVFFLQVQVILLKQVWGIACFPHLTQDSKLPGLSSSTHESCIFYFQ